MLLRTALAAAAAAVGLLACSHAVAQPQSGTARQVFGAVADALLDALSPDEVRRLPMDRQQAWIDERIAAGTRDGSLTAREAARVRMDAQRLARLEADYRRNGLTASEQAELTRRFDALSARVYTQRHDDPVRNDVSLTDRMVRLEARVAAGRRNGDLTAAEARAMRADLRRLERRDAQYRIGGLDRRERDDLDRRLDALSSRIKSERHDPEERQWVSVNVRQAELQRRIDAGVHDGSLTRAEANRLRREFRKLSAMEDRYRRGGLSYAERAELDRRFDALRNQIRMERYDSQANAR